ncbi:Metallophosphoesterase [Sulfurimonas denitrificans DSM 1251]|jgi:UDP-2,3-diacylglucosamine hydrolase|uniref:Metallophosphoesterase n=1 Tax=Sulfurimonas denitrificans (strain ATCC 33889 / DSM 1251) TaxID=326298 RepID=Q30QC2_SULDN|nr:metallophosphoesterase [Sulfurimonas denitrificans]ABB44809.1 Metallophosphoesterase [Sulfurimonas denitrificans DSM 1251]MDD3443365.1 metallophosphoesterase [Sulfurimonas denitrificans]
MQKEPEILEGAFVVADAHFSYERPLFLDFLKEINSQTLRPTQLILMGDIFDSLFGEIPSTHVFNQEAIALINKISNEIEVLYFEGNHDFNLSEVFPNVKIFPISSQPLTCNYKDKRVLLCHGDIEGAIGYKIYTKIIRNHYVLIILRVIDTLLNNGILKRLDKYLSQKNDCKEFIGLESFMLRRLEGKYRCDYFVEGHFHQNKMIKMRDFIYINLGAFACNQRYFIVKSTQHIELFEEKIFSKGI